jgi:glycosyltransferase involved in cell wall biosynthesis
LQIPRRYIFWQPIPSMHQMPFLEHLHEVVDGEVICVHAEDVPADRLELGWSRPRALGVRLVRASEADSINLIHSNDAHSLHCFSGLHCHPYIAAKFREVIASNAPVGLLSEAHDGYGLRGALRKLRSYCDCRRYASRIAMVLAMGRLGVNWYRDAGYRSGVVFPFAYVAEPSRVPADPPETNAGPFTIAFVGQLIHRKGVDLLFESLGSLMHLPWRLEVAGVGPLESALRQQADAAGFSDRVVWRGSLPNQRISAMLGACDLLALPSRFDGWGVVVNEALAAGTPVVCSDACGAADLVAKPVLGQVVSARSITHLAEAIRDRIHLGRTNSRTRAIIREHACQFAPASIAKYFIDIVTSVCRQTEAPSVPWRNMGPCR